MNRRTRKVIYAVAAVAFLALIVWNATRPKPGESVADLGNKHLTNESETHAPYNSSPPTSGPHLNQKARWGVYDEQIPDELQVHNLEDGGVIVHYDPEKADASLIASLTTVVESYSDRVILEPYAGLETPVVLTAWTRMDKLDAFDEARIRTFIDTYIGIDHHK